MSDLTDEQRRENIRISKANWRAKNKESQVKYTLTHYEKNKEDILCRKRERYSIKKAEQAGIQV